MGWQLHARTPLTIPSGNNGSHVAEVHNTAGQLLMEVCRACHVGVVTGRVQPDVPPSVSFTHRSTHSVGQSRPDHFVCSPHLFAHIDMSCVLQHVGGSDHLPVTLQIQHPASRIQPQTCQDSLLPCPPVLKWRGSEQLYSEKVQQSIREGGLQLALALLPTQGPAAATAAFLEVLRRAATSAGHPLLSRCDPRPPRRNTSAWFDATCARLRRGYRKQCARFGAHHPEAQRLLKIYKQRCQLKKRQYASDAVAAIVRDAKRDPRMFWRHLKRVSVAQQVPSAGDPQECTQFFSGLFNKRDADADPVPPPGQPIEEPDMVLNVAVSEQEVTEVLAGLRSGCSSGSDGVPAEFFRCAVQRDADGRVLKYLLAPYLAQLFDWCFQTGATPDDWGLALLSMIHKGGDTADWGNYRPIAVVQVISKMYAMLLSNRLQGWAESQGDARKPSQAGFRPVYSTSFNTFTLNHFINKSKANKRSLYCCFVDLEKAYDSTPRDKLWQRLHDLGIRGRMLFAIAALYADVKYQIKFTNGLSKVFGGDTGVRQGCPLSPFLFGVFVEMLHERIHAELPAEGPSFEFTEPRVHVPLLLFADDVALLSYTPQGLQRLLQCLADFCDLNHLTVNQRKTKVVIFHKSMSRAPHPLQFTLFKGRLLPFRMSISILV